MKYLLMAILMISMSAPAQPASQPAGVPAGAKEVEPNLWRHVDSDGKSWLIKRTPFGWMRTEEPAAGGNVLPNGKWPDGVPKDAKQVGPDRFRWIDEKGQAWIYLLSATGVMRSQEVSGEDAKQGPLGAKMAGAGSDTLHLISVKEEGDSLRFSKPGPFGKYSWVKKKTQLDEDETIVWQNAKAAAKPKPAAKPKAAN